MSDQAWWRLAQLTKMVDQQFAESELGAPHETAPRSAAHALTARLRDHMEVTNAAQLEADRLATEARAAFADVDTLGHDVTRLGRDAQHAFGAMDPAVAADRSAETEAATLLGRLQAARDGLAASRRDAP